MHLAAGTAPVALNNCAGGIIIERQPSATTTTACVSQVMTGNTFQNIVGTVNNTAGNSTTTDTYPFFQSAQNTGVTYIPNTNFANIDVVDVANANTVRAGYGPGSSSFGFAP